MEPTAWFMYKSKQTGEPLLVARWGWPKTTETEFWKDGKWQEDQDRLFLEIHDEPGWKETDEATVNEWIKDNTKV